MSRERIDMNDTTRDVLIKMSEGIPGAISVMMAILTEHPDGVFRLLELDDMNMRGSQIWIGFKDHCGQDLARFVECVKTRDPAMIETVNRNRGGSNAPDEIAVPYGGSARD